jgi:hypothetical protein
MADNPKAASVSLESFIEVATAAALRAIDAHKAQADLNPQPLPPGAEEPTVARAGIGPIIIGIIFEPKALAE